MKRVLFWLVFVVYSCMLYPFSSSWNFETMMIRDGLNDNTIYDICYGNSNFIWVSTDRGISRYDGFRFRNYPLTISCDSVSKPLPQAVKSLKKTSTDLFYAQLYQGGIVAFDIRKEIYLPIRFDRPFSMRDIQDFFIDSNTVYLCTSNGLYKGTVSRICENGEDYILCNLTNDKLIAGKITSICGEKLDMYMVVDGRKVIHYNTVTKKISLIKEGERLGKLFYLKEALWISQAWNGVIYYNLKNRVERLFNLGVNYFNNSYITDIIQRDEKSFYLSTWSGLFNLEFNSSDLINSSYSLEAVSNDINSHSGIECRMTSMLWNKRQQILWVGTFGGGMIKFILNDERYSQLEQKLDDRIGGLAEDGKGYIWLITTSGSVMKSVTNSLSEKTRFVPWGKVDKLTERYFMYKDRNGRLWLGGDRGNIVFIDPLTEETFNFSLKVNGKGITARISEFCLDSRNRLWIATDKGLFQGDPQTLICKQVCAKEKVLREKVYTVAEDKEGNIWIGTKIGLKRLEINGEEILIKGNYELANGLGKSPVITIYVNNYNQIYAAYLNSVIRIDGRNKNKVEAVYTLLNGLTSGHVMCMIDDLNGNTWAGSNEGVITIRNGQSVFYNYLSRGNYSSVCRLRDGRLLWANSNNVIFFDPTLAKVDVLKKKLYLTDLEVDGETIMAGESKNGQIILSSSPDKQEKFVFTVDNNDFRMYFSDLKYGMMKRKIAYRLLPEYEEWKTKPLSEGLWFKHLPVGKYMLEVKLMYPDGSEGQVLQVPIVLKPNWYMTMWALLGYGLLVIALGYFIYICVEKRNIKKRVHCDREMALKENLNFERMKQEQKQEIEAMRNQMLMLFVQELRTPLSLIIGPLKDLIKDNSSFAMQGQVAYRNALRMMDACDQLMGIYGEDSLTDKLEVAPYFAEKLVDNVLFDIRELLSACTIDFHYEKRIKKDLEFLVNKNKIDLVIRNLLSNAFTHTHYSGKVSVILCETMEEGRHFFTIIVEDNGKTEVSGSEPECSSNYNREVTNGFSPIGLGYDLMQRILDMHHGNILIDDSTDAGTKVLVNLPLDKDVYDGDESVVLADPEKLSELQPRIIEDAIFKLNGSTAKISSVETLIAEEVTSTVNSKGKNTLLIVEDHKDIRLYLKVMFGKEYNLLMATNGQEGVEMAMKELPDLIICDVMMPIKDGFECCREVKEGLETCNIPFILLTAKVEDDDIIKGLELGADDYILKPFTPGVLKAKVHNLISGRQSLKQIYTKLLMLPGVDTAQTEESDDNEEEVKEDPFIKEVITIIEGNICEADFNVKKLASELNMSQPTLYRKVKQSTDYTIIELIRGVRMRRAAVLLKTKQYGVQEVAEMVGYNDIPTFRKHFVDAFGTTPSTYE